MNQRMLVNYIYVNIDLNLVLSGFECIPDVFINQITDFTYQSRKKLKLYNKKTQQSSTVTEFILTVIALKLSVCLSH